MYTRLELAKAACAESRQQARVYQRGQRRLRDRAKVEMVDDEPLVQRGGFRPFLEF